jgi:GntP family gluconate:H+ symporter
LIEPLTADLGFDTPSKLSLAIVMIGAGSMVVSHADDSYFWVVTELR